MSFDCFIEINSVNRQRFCIFELKKNFRNIEFEIKEVKRGRPKKTVAVSDTDSEVSLEPKKRGRPRKDKRVVSELSPGDDLIAGLIKEAKEKDFPDITSREL